ncbi:MAG TPA: hypothetical protein VMR52_08900 [Dehalococcoidia bacterium]|nr:hypothetical protein [Dehalococcoidia bacterium]
MGAKLGEQFVQPLANKDRDRLRQLFTADLDFRGMTPNQFWEAETADAAIGDVLFGKWYEPHEVIRKVLSVEHDGFLARKHVGYRLLVEKLEGMFLVTSKPTTRNRTDGSAGLRVMCCGLQPAP